MPHLRQTVSGGTVGSLMQQADELRRLRREDRDILLHEAGLAPHVMAGHGKGLALKADLYLPWYKIRKLWRWLSSFRVSLDSEATMREQVSQQLPFDLIAELVPLADRSGQVTMKSVVRFPDLIGLVMHYLGQHTAAGMLSWHSGAFAKGRGLDKDWW